MVMRTSMAYGLFDLAEDRLGKTLLKNILQRSEENPLLALRVAQYEARRVRALASRIVGMLEDARAILEDELLAGGVDDAIVAHAMNLDAGGGATFLTELSRWDDLRLRYATAVKPMAAV
jgi:hypothetical protein